MAQDPPILSSDRKARKLDREFSELPSAAQGLFKPAENERLTAGLHQESFDQQVRIVYGRIIFAMPYAHWYRVQLDAGDVEMACCAMVETGLQPLGVRNTSTIPAMSRVLVLQPHGQDFGVILGVVPRIMTPGSAILPDWISQGSNCGVLRERYYNQFPAFFDRSGDMVDFSSNRPVDSLSTGEWGRFTDLGGGIFIDPFMQYFRVDEMCGMFMFYMDRLMRLCGHNFDFRSAISEQMIRNDNGEGLNYTGYGPYPWEAVGALRPGTTTHRTVDDKNVQSTEPLGKFEPKFDDQQPFNRFEEYRDYLGQGYMRHVQVPRDNSEVTLQRYSQSQAGIGVFREQVFLDGMYTLSSAHSLHLVKRVINPIPKRIRVPEDGKGDDLAVSSGYKFASLYGEGKNHLVKDHPPGPSGGSAPWQATALPDILAYCLNWKSLHPFHYHAKDFVTPEYGTPFDSIQTPLDFGQLQEVQWLPTPEPRTVAIDHRYSAKFYEIMSAISMLPDGGIVIRGGAGCELRLAAGTAAINAPGDVMIQSGRHIINYAGDDSITKARNSVDITAGRHDVRLKAQNNMDLMSGNSGTGRLMLESRATGTRNDVVNLQGEDVAQNGIILSAPNADVATLAGRNAYLRTGSGQITLDAAQGGAAVRIVASGVNNFIASSFNIVINSSASPVVHSFGLNSQVQSSLVIGGTAIVQSGIQVHGNVAAVDGQVGPIDANSPNYSRAVETHTRVSEQFTSFGERLQNDFTNGVTNVWYSDGQIGNENVIANTQFAPRSEAQMNARNFQLPETAYQQLAAGGLPVWIESVITYQGVDMMPHPGLDNWQTKKALLRTKLNFHDVKTGLDAARGETYEDPATGSFDQLLMAEHYQVIGEQL